MYGEKFSARLPLYFSSPMKMAGMDLEQGLLALKN
jgi:hypothetical protein